MYVCYIMDELENKELTEDQRLMLSNATDLLKLKLSNNTEGYSDDVFSTLAYELLTNMNIGILLKNANRSQQLPKFEKGIKGYDTDSIRSLLDKAKEQLENTQGNLMATFLEIDNNTNLHPEESLHTWIKPKKSRKLMRLGLDYMPKKKLKKWSLEKIRNLTDKKIIKQYHENIRITEIVKQSRKFVMDSLSYCLWETIEEVTKKWIDQDHHLAKYNIIRLKGVKPKRYVELDGITIDKDLNPTTFFEIKSEMRKGYGFTKLKSQLQERNQYLKSVNPDVQGIWIYFQTLGQEDEMIKPLAENLKSTELTKISDNVSLCILRADDILDRWIENDIITSKADLSNLRDTYNKFNNQQVRYDYVRSVIHEGKK